MYITIDLTLDGRDAALEVRVGGIWGTKYPEQSMPNHINYDLIVHIYIITTDVYDKPSQCKCKCTLHKTIIVIYIGGSFPMQYLANFTTKICKNL